MSPATEETRVQQCARVACINGLEGVRSGEGVKTARRGSAHCDGRLFDIADGNRSGGRRSGTKSLAASSAYTGVRPVLLHWRRRRSSHARERRSTLAAAHVLVPFRVLGRWFNSSFDHQRFRSCALKQKSGTRQRQPSKDQIHDPPRNQKRERDADPQAETSKTVHQLSED
jgi:hypothetical protein